MVGAGLRLLALLILLVCVPGCYHLRLAAAPIDAFRFTVPRAPADVFAETRQLLDSEGYAVESADSKNGIIVTAYRHFITDAGVTQPVGGRLYFHRLKVAVRNHPSGTEVSIESTGLEIRSSYVSNEDGRVSFFKKRYPYENYPSMFDLNYVNRELKRVRAFLQRSLDVGT